MWLHHLFSFFATFLSYFFNAIGTTFLGLCLGLALAVSTYIATLRRIDQRNGKAAMLKHWKEDGKVALRVSVICALIIYGPVALWKFSQVVYDDHIGLSKRVHILRGITAGGAEHERISVTAVRDSLNGQLSEIKQKCAFTDGQNQTLSNQNRDQQTLIAGCQEDAIKRLTTSQKTTVILFERDNSSTLDREAKFLLITNVRVSPIRMTITCNKPVTSWETSSLPMPNVIFSNGSRVINPRQYQVDMENEQWTPESPFKVEIKYLSSGPIECFFK